MRWTIAVVIAVETVAGKFQLGEFRTLVGWMATRVNSRPFPNQI